MQYAACLAFRFCFFLFGGRAEAGDGVQFDSDYSGGDDASIFFFLGECCEEKRGVLRIRILLICVEYV